MARWRGTNCWNAWWTQIVFARRRRPQWGWHLYVAESALLYFKYFIPCCQCPHLAPARGRRRGASNFATFVGRRETRRKNTVVGRRFQCLHRTCWRPWLHWFSRTMRNGEQKPAKHRSYSFCFRKEDFGSAIARWMWSMHMTAGHVGAISMAFWYKRILLSVI
jgi:hypothetical protein